MIVGLCGLIGSGKDTAADYLVNHCGFVRESFANHLKDIAAVLFGWDRELLEGRSDKSRNWREQVDTWWSERLNFTITPRFALQYLGTDVFRNHFHNDIWIASLENKLSKISNNVVITDCRFPNEIAAIKKLNGKVFRIVRGQEPDWFEDAKCFLRGPERNIGWALSRQVIEDKQIHPSEYSWVLTDFDAIINNDKDLDVLYSQLKTLM
ncbi:MAG: hypothetical protein RLZZ196_213 [Bacteroidota bacterium]|jgi:hypothetical protein